MTTEIRRGGTGQTYRSVRNVIHSRVEVQAFTRAPVRGRVGLPLPSRPRVDEDSKHRTGVRIFGYAQLRTATETMPQQAPLPAQHMPRRLGSLRLHHRPQRRPPHPLLPTMRRNHPHPTLRRRQTPNRPLDQQTRTHPAPTRRQRLSSPVELLASGRANHPPLGGSHAHHCLAHHPLPRRPHNQA